MTLGETIIKLKKLVKLDFEENKKEIVALIEMLEVPELVYDDEEEQTKLMSGMYVPQDWWWN
jgi:hypothetical protein